MARRGYSLINGAGDAQSLKQTLAQIGNNIPTGEDWAPTLSSAVEKWYNYPMNDYLQLIGKVASANKEYLDKVHQILEKRYPTGCIRVFRGSGQSNSPLRREFVNVTGSEKVAREFGRVGIEITLPIADVVAITSPGESEFVVRSDTLRDRIENPGLCEFQARKSNPNWQVINGRWVKS